MAHTAMMRADIRRAILPLVLVVVAVASIVTFSRFRAVLTLLGLFPPAAVALLVALVLLAQAVKIARWHYFVRAAGVPILWRDSATSLLAGQTASVLPGGDLLRVRLAAEHGVLPRTGITISFAMWATDMMALPLLVLAGYGKHLVARWVLFVPLAIPLALLLLVRSHRFARWVSRGLARFRWTRRYALSEEEIARTTYLLTRPRIVLGGILFALMMRLVFSAFLLIITNIVNDAPLRFETVISIHALSTLAGSFPLLSGLAALGSQTELLRASGVPRVLGLLIGLANRSINVAFNVGLGFLVLLTRYRMVFFGTHKEARDESKSDSPSVVSEPAVSRRE